MSSIAYPMYFPPALLRYNWNTKYLHVINVYNLVSLHTTYFKSLPDTGALIRKCRPKERVKSEYFNDRYDEKWTVMKKCGKYELSVLH